MNSLEPQTSPTWAYTFWSNWNNSPVDDVNLRANPNGFPFRPRLFSFWAKRDIAISKQFLVPSRCITRDIFRFISHYISISPRIFPKYRPLHAIIATWPENHCLMMKGASHVYDLYCMVISLYFLIAPHLSYCQIIRKFPENLVYIQWTYINLVTYTLYPYKTWLNG